MADLGYQKDPYATLLEVFDWMQDVEDADRPVGHDRIMDSVEEAITCGCGHKYHDKEGCEGCANDGESEEFFKHAFFQYPHGPEVIS